ncbi:hypothetical protein QBC38DRAFT_488808 [Podospora fimiseda]|uniref:DUF676 domain-containing protein n=1 Tax=Podospora fimiseda TaxID=252190 RepID=A0AAN7BG52_9PEZI|nr:hypothetical protein QBC38DRAFT_488808 [Podospora fimiseda]
MAGPGLHLLYPAEGISATTFDIVAIHGLGGNAFNTWTHISREPGSKSPIWLRDFLPNAFPHARIFTYGYTTGPGFFNNVVTNIRDYGRPLRALLNSQRDELPKERPIIFICHSLGGIILKEAIIEAHERSDRNDWIISAPKAVMFMGTPHRGAPIAAFLKFAGHLVPGLHVPKNWAAELSPGSKTLEDSVERFVQHGSKLRDIVSFYETEKQWWMDGAIVGRSSAVMHQCNELPLPLTGDHHQICKYSSPADPNYVLVKGEIKRIVKDVFKLACPPPAVFSQHSFTWPQTGTPDETVDEILDQASDQYSQQDFLSAYTTYQRALLFLDLETTPNLSQFFFTYSRLIKCALNLTAQPSSSASSSSTSTTQRQWLLEAERLNTHLIESVNSPRVTPIDEYRVFIGQVLCLIRREEIDQGGLSQERKKGFLEEMVKVEIGLEQLKDVGYNESEIEGLLSEVRWIKEYRLELN